MFTKLCMKKLDIFIKQFTISLTENTNKTHWLKLTDLKRVEQIYTLTKIIAIIRLPELGVELIN